jgi:hypothetical protein
MLSRCTCASSQRMYSPSFQIQSAFVIGAIVSLR